MLKQFGFGSGLWATLLGVVGCTIIVLLSWDRYFTARRIDAASALQLRALSSHVNGSPAELHPKFRVIRAKYDVELARLPSKAAEPVANRLDLIAADVAAFAELSPIGSGRIRELAQDSLKDELSKAPQIGSAIWEHEHGALGGLATAFPVQITVFGWTAVWLTVLVLNIQRILPDSAAGCREQREAATAEAAAAA